MTDQPRTEAGRDLLFMLRTHDADDLNMEARVLAIEAEAAERAAAPRDEGLVRELLAALEAEIAMHPYEADVPTTVIKARDRALARLSGASTDS